MTKTRKQNKTSARRIKKLDRKKRRANERRNLAGYAYKGGGFLKGTYKRKPNKKKAAPSLKEHLAKKKSFFEGLREQEELDKAKASEAQ